MKKISQKINLALIGAGGMGKRWAWVITQSPSFSLRMIVDQNISIAGNLALGLKDCEVETDYRRVLNRNDIDAVLIATPTFLLAPITLATLKAGKHVICEKPGAIKSSDIKKAMILAKRKKLIYLVSFNHRYHEAFLKADSFIKSGKIGEILFIRARYGFGGRPGYEKEWRNKKSLGGGELLDQGVHMIDLAKYFLGEIRNVAGFAENLFWKSQVDDNAFLLLKNENNRIASIHVSWTNWDPIHSFEIYGTKGFLKVEGLGRKYGGGEKLILGIRSENFIGLPEEKVIICDSEANNSLIRILKEFSDAFKAGRETKPSSLEVYETLKIVEKIYAKK